MAINLRDRTLDEAVERKVEGNSYRFYNFLTTWAALPADDRGRILDLFIMICNYAYGLPDDRMRQDFIDSTGVISRFIFGNREFNSMPESRVQKIVGDLLPEYGPSLINKTRQKRSEKEKATPKSTSRFKKE